MTVPIEKGPWPGYIWSREGEGKIRASRLEETDGKLIFHLANPICRFEFGIDDRHDAVDHADRMLRANDDDPVVQMAALVLMSWCVGR